MRVINNFFMDLFKGEEKFSVRLFKTYIMRQGFTLMEVVINAFSSGVIGVLFLIVVTMPTSIVRRSSAVLASRVSSGTLGGTKASAALGAPAH